MGVHCRSYLHVWCHPVRTPQAYFGIKMAIYFAWLGMVCMFGMFGMFGVFGERLDISLCYLTKQETVISGYHIFARPPNIDCTSRACLSINVCVTLIFVTDSDSGFYAKMLLWPGLTGVVVEAYFYSNGGDVDLLTPGSLTMVRWWDGGMVRW